MAMSTKVSPTLLFYIILFYSSVTFFAFNNVVLVSAQCQGNFQGLLQQCSRYVQRSGPRTNPSQGCCDVVKNVDLACVCDHITPEVEQIISMEKAAFVAGACGKPLPHGTKCGAYTVP